MEFEERANTLARVIREAIGRAGLPNPADLTSHPDQTPEQQEDGLAVYAEAFRIVSEDYEEARDAVLEEHMQFFEDKRKAELGDG